ncbi:MAG: biopolymer transporter ExbD [Nevskiaceae bacterium]|nr:MAG: biopolymer transporter ExbD [Nevskiaceae bacterium]
MRIERPARRRNSIVLTSLVDVMFVLLFFFMLASSYLDWGTLDVNIGGKPASSPGTLPPAHALLLLPGGQWRLDGRPLDPARLEATLPSASRVVVQPAAGVSLQELVAVVDRLKAAGVALTLGAAPP